LESIQVHPVARRFIVKAKLETPLSGLSILIPY